MDTKWLSRNLQHIHMIMTIDWVFDLVIIALPFNQHCAFFLYVYCPSYFIYHPIVSDRILSLVKERDACKDTRYTQEEETDEVDYFNWLLECFSSIR